MVNEKKFAVAVLSTHIITDDKGNSRMISDIRPVVLCSENNDKAKAQAIALVKEIYLHPGEWDYTASAVEIL